MNHFHALACILSTCFMNFKQEKDLLIDPRLVGGIVECTRHETYLFGNFFKGADLTAATNVQCGLRSVYYKVFSWNRLLGFAWFVF